MKYRKHLIIAAAIICNLTAAGCVTAYFMSADEAANVFRTGYVDSEIVEDYDPPPVLIPGISFKKNVAVRNTGTCPSYVRIQAVFSDGDMEKQCTLDWNTEDYDYKEGYYYYKKILETGETTEPLFTSVKVSENAEAEDMKNFEILIYAEAYQSAGSDNYAEAWRHFGRNSKTNI